MFGLKMTDIAKDILGKHLKEGDKVIDATVGNGNDTIFLAKKVGSTGKVYGFDIQKKAIDKTREKLTKLNIEDRVILLFDTHEKIKNYINQQVMCVMFNLGYLPNGDKSIITKDASTIIALGQALELLKENGIISVVCYYGHDGGIKEKEAVEEYIKGLNTNKYEVISIRNDNRIHNSPILFLIKKVSRV
ncbi:MAG: class I SAM-dependent methyltransferase [Eubacteriales bacterium]